MPSAPLRWGVISRAHIARQQFIPGVRAGNESEVLAIASREERAAQAAAVALGIPRAYGSYEDLLEDRDVDAVYIALPNSLHAEWIVRSAQAGKHVLCEKPLARRAADAERAAEACRAAGVLLMEAFMWRHHPQQARVRWHLDQGAIGAPRLVRASFSYVVRPTSPSGDLNVRLSSKLEGGVLMDIGCYAVDTARWVFGEEPVEVVGHQLIDPGYGVDVAFVGVLRFSGDRLALVDCDFGTAGVNRYEIAGSEGRIGVERAYRPDTQSAPIVLTRQDTRTIEDIPSTNQYGHQADHFARSVRTGRLLPPAEDGVAQSRVVEALYASASEGRPRNIG
jgi:predicted dehydrogenase